MFRVRVLGVLAVEVEGVHLHCDGDEEVVVGLGEGFGVGVLEFLIFGEVFKESSAFFGFGGYPWGVVWGGHGRFLWGDCIKRRAAAGIFFMDRHFGFAAGELMHRSLR